MIVDLVGLDVVMKTWWPFV